MIRPTTKQPRPNQVDLAAVRALAEPLAAVHGVIVLDVEWVFGPAGQVLRVTLERDVGEPGMAEEAPEGVSIDDCARVSRDLSAALDVEDVIAQAYSLEVSSPGLDRPLKTAADFERQVGRLAKLKLIESTTDGQRVLRGTILDVDGERIGVVVDGNRHDVLLANVSEARLVFEIGGQSKKRTRGKGAGRTRKRCGASKTTG